MSHSIIHSVLFPGLLHFYIELLYMYKENTCPSIGMQKSHKYIQISKDAE